MITNLKMLVKKLLLLFFPLVPILSGCLKADKKKELFMQIYDDSISTNIKSALYVVFFVRFTFDRITAFPNVIPVTKFNDLEISEGVGYLLLIIYLQLVVILLIFSYDLLITYIREQKNWKNYKGKKMAQYTYAYLCGHGRGTVRLYGKESELQRKLAWCADTFVCPDCFKKQKMEEDAASPKTASLHLAVYDEVYLSIQVHGQLSANKEALKQLGYCWDDEIDGGLLALFKRPKLALQKWDEVLSIEDIQATAKLWSDELTELGYTITSVPSIFDQQAAKHHFGNAAKKEKQEQRQA